MIRHGASGRGALWYGSGYPVLHGRLIDDDVIRVRPHGPSSDARLPRLPAQENWQDLFDAVDNLFQRWGLGLADQRYFTYRGKAAA